MTDGSNGFDKVLLNSAITKIEEIMAELRSEKGAYMARCKEIAAGIAPVYEQAKEAGIPKKALKTYIKKRAAEEKIRQREEALEPDVRDAYIRIREDMGDFANTPLGAATLQRESVLDQLLA